jgi:hypothetical protein
VNIEIVEDGVVPSVGVSALGVGRGFTPFTVVAVGRGSGGLEESDGVLGGRGGKEEAVATAFSAASSLAGNVTILRTPGIDRFSAALTTG